MLAKNIFSIGIIGPSKTSTENNNLLEQLYGLGEEMAKRNVTLLVPAESGYPLWVSKGVNNQNGIVVAFDSRASRKEREKIGLNQDFYSTVIYTNSTTSGRDLLMISACDAVLFLGITADNLADLSMCAGENKLIGLLENDFINDKVINVFLTEIGKKTKIIRDHRPMVLFDQVFDLLSLS